MRILLRYQLRELLVPFAAWVLFLYLLLLVMQFLRGSELLLGSAVRPTDMLRILVYLGPHFLMMAVPIAFLLAILLGFGRLSEDRELVALGAMGVSAPQLSVLPLLIGVVLAGTLLALTFTGEPWGLARLKSQANDVIKRNLIGDVRAGVFYEDLNQLTLYVEDVDPDERRWRNVLIHDDRDGTAPLLVLARDGRVQPTEATTSLRFSLTDGQVHRSAASNVDYTVVSFERGDLAVGLEEYIHQKNRLPRSPKEELTPGELLMAADAARQDGRDPRPFLMAFHWRLGRALTPIPFALLGAPLGMSRRSAGRARGLMLTLLAYIAYYVVARMFENLGTQGRIPVLLAGQAANFLFAALGLAGLWRVTRMGGVR